MSDLAPQKIINILNIGGSSIATALYTLHGVYLHVFYTMSVEENMLLELEQ